MVGLVFNYLRPLPMADATLTSLQSAASSTRLDWPASGSAAIGAQDFGVLATHGSQAQKPMASLAKLVTVLAVLEKHPLAKGQQGPKITLGDNDVALFNKYFAEGGAYVKVEAGERITQYQALQALLLPSANNMADSLAIWAFGSMEAYHQYAKDFTLRHNLTATVIATDASGMQPTSKSTPTDLIKLGELALAHPVVEEIIKQPSATIPVHGVIYSANSRLGAKVIGIKTGLTDEAGGCFLFAAKHTVEGQKPITIIGVITGAPNLREAIVHSSKLAQSAKSHFSLKTPIKAGEVFATLKTPWLTAGAKVIAKQDITLVAWNGISLVPRLELSDINRSLPAGTQVGTAIVASGSHQATTPLVLQQAIHGPTWQWRIKRF